MWQSFSTQIILFKQKWRVKEYVLAVVSWSNRSDTSVFVKGEKTWQIREVKRSYGFQCAAFVLRPLLFEWAVFMSKRKNECICFSSKTWIYCITYASPSHEQSHVPLSLSLSLSISLSHTNSQTHTHRHTQRQTHTLTSKRTPWPWTGLRSTSRSR